MLKNLLLVVVLCLLCLTSFSPGSSQVVGAALGPAHEWYAGAEYSRLNPDYWAYPTVFMNGLSVYGGYNDFVRPHFGFGVEGTWRTLLDRDSGRRKENSYLVSGRLMYRASRFQPFIKGGGGLGDFNSNGGPGTEPVPGQNGTHLVGAVGAGIDVLGPHSYNFGVAYRFY
jgi:hypothetical protein